MHGESKKTLLLVEDEAILALTEKMSLEKYGYSVFTVTSGEKAVERVQSKEDIDLILMDIDLGRGIDGTAAAEQILRDHDIPIVFLSSHTEPEIVEKTEKITSYGYVEKNSSITVLDTSIKMAFRLFEANQKVKRSDIYHKTMLSNISEVIGIIGVDGIMRYKSPNIEKWFGWQPQDLMGKDGWLTVHPDDLERIQRIFHQLLERENSSTTLEFLYQCKDGSYKPVELTATNLNGNPQIAGVLLNYRDITERKQAIENLRKSEAKFKSYIENAPDGVFVTDEQGRYLEVNEAACRITGYSEEELLNGSIPELIQEEYLQKAENHFQAVAKVGSASGVLGFVTKSGEKRFWNVDAVKLSDNRFLGFTKDITEGKLAEEAAMKSTQKLRNILEHSTNLFYSHTTDHILTYLSPQVEEILGYTVKEAMSRWTDFVSDNPVNEIGFQNTVKAIETGERQPTYELEMVRKDGRKIIVEVRESPLVENGKTSAIIGSLVDISERKQAVENLHSIEWMLSKKTKNEIEHLPEYGDVSGLNKDGLILTSVGKEPLVDIVSEYLDLLETSAAIYEKNGDYALGIFSSGWCQLLDSASRRLCGTEDNQKALNSGKWLCHESCWKCSLRSMEEGQSVEVSCVGGLKLYAVPVLVNGEVVGAVNFGYGNPPTGKAELRSLSEKYHISVDVLRKHAKAYNPRPQFIIDYAKERIQVAAKNLGYLIERKQAEKERNQQLKEKETLLKEVHHRIKNNIASIEGLLSMHVQSLSNPEAISALKDAVSRVQGMRILYEKLLSGKDYQEVSMKEYSESLVDAIAAVFPESENITMKKQIADFTIHTKRLIPVGIIINELLTNVYKYAFKGADGDSGCMNRIPAGQISIVVEKTEKEITLTIQDNGNGIEERVDLNKSPGFGLMIVRMLTEQLGGTFTIENNKGTRSILQFTEDGQGD